MRPADIVSVHTPSPTWQCVMICWGTKYSTQLINNLVRHIAAQAASVPRFVLITDADKPELLDGVQVVHFPARWLQAPLKRSGCQAKLVMFEQGVLPEDLPAIYVDLDTIVLGDLQQGLALLETPQTVALLPSALIPFGPLGRLRYRCTQGRHYARGNSSLVVFHPAHHHDIARRFLDLFARFPNFEFRPMIADERFISWAAQPHMKAIPKHLAVKFPGEFMFYWGWWLYVRALLPWVRARRRRLVAVTLNGLLVKPEKLLSLPDGGKIVDEKGRVLIWSPHTLGAVQQHIRDFYQGQL